MPQDQGTADFLLNRIGPGNDLIVQIANDFRGNITRSHWDQSLSGYYVHRSTKAGCSVDFEGGLPMITFQGVSTIGIGGVTVAADPARDAVFVSDQRFGNPSGVGVFRASATTLLDPTLCPKSTHLEAQAESCWTVTPAFLFPNKFGAGDAVLAVDERATGAGTGAGDVYVLGQPLDSNTQEPLSIVACTNSLNCGSNINGVPINGSDSPSDFSDIRVRADGSIIVSYITLDADGVSDDIKFVICTPAGAPNPPVCAAPTLVQKVTQPIGFDIDTGSGGLWNIHTPTDMFPRLASRAESGGAFTTFLVYEDCQSPPSSLPQPSITDIAPG